VATFVGLLMEVDTAQNVVEYINEYLGGSSVLNARRFAEDFLVRRRKEARPPQGPYNVGIIALSGANVVAAARPTSPTKQASVRKPCAVRCATAPRAT
jgi:hypothetical protein